MKKTHMNRNNVYNMYLVNTGSLLRTLSRLEPHMYSLDRTQSWTAGWMDFHQDTGSFLLWSLKINYTYVIIFSTKKSSGYSISCFWWKSAVSFYENFLCCTISYNNVISWFTILSKYKMDKMHVQKLKKYWKLFRSTV